MRSDGGVLGTAVAVAAAVDDLNAYKIVPRAEVGREIAEHDSFMRRSVFSRSFNLKKK